MLQIHLFKTSADYNKFVGQHSQRAVIEKNIPDKEFPLIFVESETPNDFYGDWDYDYHYISLETLNESCIVSI